MKVHNFNAKVRKFSSAREAALSENFVPESVYDSLGSSCEQTFATLATLCAIAFKNSWNLRLEDVRYVYAIIRYRLQVYL